MPRSNYARTMYYLTLDEKSATPPLLHQAMEQLTIPIPQIEPEQLVSTYQHSKHKILLLDYQQHEALRQRLGPLKLTSSHLETILFNVDKRLHTDTLLSFGNLKGVFYQTATADKLANGLAEIINGQNRLPRHVSNQLLHYYRYFSKIIKSKQPLT